MKQSTDAEENSVRLCVVFRKKKNEQCERCGGKYGSRHFRSPRKENCFAALLFHLSLFDELLTTAANEGKAKWSIPENLARSHAALAFVQVSFTQAASTSFLADLIARFILFTYLFSPFSSFL